MGGKTLLSESFRPFFLFEMFENVRFGPGISKPMSNSSRRNKHQNSKSSALLLIDVINHFRFPDGDQIYKQALKIAPRLSQLKGKAIAAGIPVIYVNDHFGDWRSERSALLAECLGPKSKGADFVGHIAPAEEDYFILKPMHSAFYQTPLETLLKYLGTKTLILAGLTTNSCITCTAQDANMRDFKVIVPSDCCAAKTTSQHRVAIEQLRTVLKANTHRLANQQFGRL